MQILKVLGVVAVTGVAVIAVIAHEIGEYINDIYDHEDFWP